MSGEDGGLRVSFAISDAERSKRDGIFVTRDD